MMRITVDDFIPPQFIRNTPWKLTAKYKSGRSNTTLYTCFKDAEKAFRRAMNDKRGFASELFLSVTDCEQELAFVVAESL